MIVEQKHGLAESVDAVRQAEPELEVGGISGDLLCSKDLENGACGRQDPLGDVVLDVVFGQRGCHCSGQVSHAGKRDKKLVKVH